MVKACVDALEKEIAEVRNREIGEIYREIASLRSGLLAGRQVDLVDFGQLRAFMYVDDMGYRVIAPEYKQKTAVPVERDLSQPFRTAEERYDNPAEPLISMLLSHYWVHGLDFTYFDIGCQYGLSAMATAHVILSAGRQNRVYAFDPGIAAALVPFNLQINRMEGRVVFEAVAIANHGLPGIVYAELGQSENNRVVNRDLRTEAFSRVVPCKTVDRVVAERGITNHLIVKMDTQGGEPEVFDGMERTVRERWVTCVAEFVPGAIATRRPPADWLRRLGESFRIFDIQENDMYLKASHRVTPVDKSKLSEFVEIVDRREPPYTDLLLIPKNLPGFAALDQRLTGWQPRPATA
jgi:FkbM family methyltransferase